MTGPATESSDLVREMVRLEDSGPEPDLLPVERGLAALLAFIVAASVVGATDAAPLIVAVALISVPLLVLGFVAVRPSGIEEASSAAEEERGPM